MVSPFLLLVLGACATPPPSAPELLGEALVGVGEGAEPLLDVVEAGFGAAFLQIRLEEGRLRSGPRGERDFELQDLRPLARAFQGEDGPDSFLLLLRVREAPEETYAALSPLLHAVRPVLTRFEGGEFVEAPIRVVLTGAVPVETLVRERTRYAFAAGGPGALESSPYSADLLPLIRVRFDFLMDWDGAGPLPSEQRIAAQALTARAHAQGRRVAVREAPQEAWEALLLTGVDYIEVGAAGSREADRLAHFLAHRGRQR